MAQRYIKYTVSIKVEGAEFSRSAEHFDERADADRFYDDQCESARREADDTGTALWVQLFEQHTKLGTLIPQRQAYFDSVAA